MYMVGAMALLGGHRTTESINRNLTKVTRTKCNFKPLCIRIPMCHEAGRHQRRQQKCGDYQQLYTLNERGSVSRDFQGKIESIGSIIINRDQIVRH